MMRDYNYNGLALAITERCLTPTPEII